MLSMKTLLFFALIASLLVPACASAQNRAMRSPGNQSAPTESQSSRTDHGGDSGQGDMAMQGGVDNPDNPSSESGSAIETEGVYGAGVGLPTGWPSDVPVMPDLTITASMNKGDGGMMVGAVGDVKMSDVADYYKDLEGWEVASDAITTPGEGRQGRSITLEKGSRNLNVYIEPGENGTQLTLTYKAGD